VSDGGSGTITCAYFAVAGVDNGPGPSLGNGGAVDDPQPGTVYDLDCRDGSGAVVYQQLVVFDPAAPPPVDGATLARQARKTLPLFFPGVETSPPYDRDQLVQVPTWLWVSSDSWQPRSASAAVPGLSATVTATPERIEWLMGDGSTEICAGPGKAYDTSKPDDAQTSYCTHTFTRASTNEPQGMYRARATMWWRVTWTATDGSSGSLPDVYRFTDFTLRVVEVQALRQGGGP
jgi:hypothetical protein